MLLAVGNDGTALGAVPGSEVGRQWLDIDGMIHSVVIVDERRQGRDMVESRVTPFLLVGPYSSYTGHKSSYDEGHPSMSPTTSESSVETTNWNVRGYFKMCRLTKKKHIGALFHDCRLAYYPARVAAVVKSVKNTFRRPPERIWLRSPAVQHLRSFVTMSFSKDEMIRWDKDRWIRDSSPDDILSPSSLILSATMSVSMGGSGPEVAEEGKASQSTLERLRLFRGWRSTITVNLVRCQIVLVQDLQDPESPLVVAAVTGSVVVDSNQTSESVEVKGLRLRISPAMAEPNVCWMDPEELPCIFPTEMQNLGNGLVKGSRCLLDTMQLNVKYSLVPKLVNGSAQDGSAPSHHQTQPGRVMSLGHGRYTSILASDTAPGGRARTISDVVFTSSDVSTDDIPHFLRVFIKHANLMQMSESVNTFSVKNPGE